MQTPNRSFDWTRTSESRGIFRTPEIRFVLQQTLGGNTSGSFVIRGREASWIGGDGRCSFRIRRGFWGQRWSFAGEGEGRAFAKISFGFFRKKIALADGGTYSMKLRRGGLIFPKRRYALLAEFFHEDDLVMTLMNTKRRKIFTSDVRRPMAGTIESSLPGMAEIWGALLLFQSWLQAREGGT